MTGTPLRVLVTAAATGIGRSEAEVRRGYERSASLRTFMTAGDVAGMVLFLCSTASKRISGQALVVDGDTETLMS